MTKKKTTDFTLDGVELNPDKFYSEHPEIAHLRLPQEEEKKHVQEIAQAFAPVATKRHHEPPKQKLVPPLSPLERIERQPPVSVGTREKEISHKVKPQLQQRRPVVQVAQARAIRARGAVTKRLISFSAPVDVRLVALVEGLGEDNSSIVRASVREYYDRQLALGNIKAVAL